MQLLNKKLKKNKRFLAILEHYDASRSFAAVFRTKIGVLTASQETANMAMLDHHAKAHL